MSYGWRPDFGVVAAEAFNSAGIPVDPTGIKVDTGYRSASAVATSLDGNLFVNAIERDNPDRTQGQLRNQYGAGPQHLFRGLLEHKSGNFSVEVNDPWGSFLRYRGLVEVEVISSPEKVNEVQRTLGRNPGDDAFKLTALQGVAGLKAGPYLDEFAEMRSPVADPEVSWTTAEHDLNPIYHTGSWLNLPPKHCRAIAGHAQKLKAKYGDRIYEPKETRPKEVTQFAIAVDNLFLHTSSYRGAVYDVEDPLFTREKFRLAVESSPAVRVWNTVHYTLEDDEQDTFLRDMKWAGVIPNELTPEQERQAAVSVGAEMVTHIAGMFLTLEEVVPKEPDTPLRRDSRMQIWRRIVDTFGRK